MGEQSQITLQAYADEAIAAKYRQTLKTGEQVASLQGWGDPAAPTCCGNALSVQTCIGNPYFAKCETCGKWAASLDGPSFSESGSSASFLDTDKVDLDTEATWIIGTAEKPR
jgi:hypothetical protein